jgi:hypothetical protein
MSITSLFHSYDLTVKKEDYQTENTIFHPASSSFVEIRLTELEVEKEFKDYKNLIIILESISILILLALLYRNR